MRGVPELLMKDLEDGAREGVKALRAFLAYEGANPIYEKKGKAAAALVTAYTRAFASETNRVAVEIAVKKMAADERSLPSDKAGE